MAILDNDDLKALKARIEGIIDEKELITRCDFGNLPSKDRHYTASIIYNEFPRLRVCWGSYSFVLHAKSTQQGSIKLCLLGVSLHICPNCLPEDLIHFCIL